MTGAVAPEAGLPEGAGDGNIAVGAAIFVEGVVSEGCARLSPADGGAGAALWTVGVSACLEGKLVVLEASRDRTGEAPNRKSAV